MSRLWLFMFVFCVCVCVCVHVCVRLQPDRMRLQARRPLFWQHGHRPAIRTAKVCRLDRTRRRLSWSHPSPPNHQSLLWPCVDIYGINPDCRVILKKLQKTNKCFSYLFYTKLVQIKAVARAKHKHTEALKIIFDLQIF